MTDNNEQLAGDVFKAIVAHDSGVNGPPRPWQEVRAELAARDSKPAATDPEKR